MPSVPVPSLSRRKAKSLENWGDLLRWANSVDDQLDDLTHSVSDLARKMDFLTTFSPVLITLVSAGPTLLANEIFFSWSHILSDQLQFFPGGVDVGRGAKSIVDGIEGYFETAPSSLTLQIMDSSSDASPQNIVVTTNYFSNFSLNKTISPGNKMYLKLNTVPGTAEFLMYCRIRFHKAT